MLCEGPLDALSSPNGVALFGKDISNIQFKMLVSKFEKLYWALDGDTTRQKKIEEFKHNLGLYLEVIDIPMESHEDPNTLGIEEMQRRIDGTE